MQSKANENDEEWDGRDREFLQGKDLSGQESYGRPTLPRIDDTQDAIEFMQIDCDYYTEKPKRELQIGK